MSTFHVAVTDLLKPDGAAGSEWPRLPAFEALLAEATIRPVPPGWHGWALAKVGLTTTGVWPLAKMAAFAAGLITPADRQWWLATPLHLEAGMVTVRFDAHGALTLDADTRAQLCAAFNRDWADVGYQLMAIGECLLLAGPTLSGTRSVDPTPFAGRWVEEARLDVGEGQGEGEVAGAKALWRLMTELQMWLHDLRLAAGDGRVLNALWLWGQGDGTVGGRAVWPRLMVEDPLLKVLAGVDPGPRQDAVLTEWSLAALARQGEAFAASDASWWGPLLADLQQARYATARVYIDGHEYECRAPRWWSRWRRRPWWQVLA